MPKIKIVKVKHTVNPQTQQLTQQTNYTNTQNFDILYIVSCILLYHFYCGRYCLAFSADNLTSFTFPSTISLATFLTTPSTVLSRVRIPASNPKGRTICDHTFSSNVN